MKEPHCTQGTFDHNRSNAFAFRRLLLMYMLSPDCNLRLCIHHTCNVCTVLSLLRRYIHCTPFCEQYITLSRTNFDSVHIV
jgi:hypothetical protein